MKKQSYLIILALCLSLFTSLVAKSTVASQAAFKSTDIDEVSNPAISVVNINNMAYWIEKSGAGTTAGSPNGQQADYPIFTGGLIYEDGMLWGVKADEYPESAPVRVGGSTYYKGMKAGFVVHDADGNVVGADDPVNHHVWRVRTDFMTADLTKDAANFYATTASNVTAEQIQNVYDQYESDWMNWPAAWGAPYEDVNGDEVFDPNTDIPGYPGAHQTVWTISNDVPTIVDANGVPTGESTNTAPNLYGADPVGVELRVTMWGYAFGASDPLGNVVFKKAELTYTGLETSSEIANPEVLDSVYFTQWSDPDLGTYTDDYVGTDIDLSFGYVYNGNRLDGVFNGIYNLPCPAGGYDFLQGPADNLDIDGDGDLTEYLPMTAFTYFGAGSSISDPDLSSYSGLTSLLKEILISEPDLIFHLGDYTSSPAFVSDMGAHRMTIADRLSVLTVVPVFAVMGNYETISLGESWREVLSAVGINVLHNQNAQLEIRDQRLCIRGLGDAFTKQLRFIGFPPSCEDATKLTITHDPAGAFEAGVRGIIFAAHTHCGQIHLPLLGAIWIPTDAPRPATCGRYEDEVRMLWVTAGVGTSILPLRLGVQAEWDLLTLRQK